MGVLNRFGRRGRNIPANATFNLTQEGKEKVHDFGGDPRSRILSVLEAGGSCNIDEISRQSGLGRGQVERLVPRLIQGGYVVYVGGSSEE